MLEQKLIEGRILDLPFAGWEIFQGAPVNGFDEAAPIVRHVDVSTSTGFFGPRVSTTSVGAHAKERRNFIWLPWRKGLVSEVRPNGCDVLTGPMSGCMILRYTKNGEQYTGHVGTDSLSPENTAQAKAAWNNFAATAPAGSATGFNPSEYWTGHAPALTKLAFGFKIFALVTGTGDFYSVFTWALRDKNKPGVMGTQVQVAAVRREPNTLPQNGQI